MTLEYKHVFTLRRKEEEEEKEEEGGGGGGGEEEEKRSKYKCSRLLHLNHEIIIDGRKSEIWTSLINPLLKDSDSQTRKEDPLKKKEEKSEQKHCDDRLSLKQILIFDFSNL